MNDYAKWLGMDLETESELMWIAREGLKAPLPPDWKPCRSPDEEIYYFNFSTGESVWEHPCDKHYKNLFEEERENLRKRRMQDINTSLSIENSGDASSTSLDDDDNDNDNEDLSDNVSVKKKQTSVTKEVDLKFKVWHQQLLNSTEAKKKKLRTANILHCGRNLYFCYFRIKCQTYLY